ncbi:MAG TPA: hypothetical protein VFR05_00415, partial [Terriglobia bacterium]|nr:hypothetical protein [Terriglobia bacterium]
GLTVDTTFYDPEAFVAPLHTVQLYNRTAPLDHPTQRYTYIQCLSNIVARDGKPTQLTNADPAYIDYYGRPWAKNWEKLEKGWDKPEPVLFPDLFGR